MKIFKDRKYLNKEIYKTSNLGFVPTMGGLHNGHKYLIKKAKKRSQKVVVSIFKYFHLYNLVIINIRII